jgi:hypothetical protein
VHFSDEQAEGKAKPSKTTLMLVMMVALVSAS